MKVTGTIWMALLAAGVSTTALAAPPTATCRARAQASLTAFTQGHYKQAAAHFAPSIAAEVSPDRLKSVWVGLQAKFGDFQNMGKLAPQAIKGQSVLVAPLTFANGKLDALLACDGQDRLTTYRFLPASLLQRLTGHAESSGTTSPMTKLAALTKAHELKPHEQIKAHVDADGIRVQPLAVHSPFGPLPGALTLPKGTGPFPAVVLVQGSGESDMNETIGPNRPFRDLAVGLAKAGIASLRYDKRGFVYPAKVAANKQLTVDDEVTDDAAAALKLLASQNGVDPKRVFVIGHSEGAMLVPRILKRDLAVAGGVMLAAPARSLLTVLEDQTREVGAKRGLPAHQIEAAVKGLEAERALLDKADPKQPPKGDLSGAPQSWWLSLHNYHQVAVAKSLSRPLLIAQGGSDFQVSPSKDFAAWKQALAGHKNVTFHLFPGLSHLFRKAGKTHTVADYLAPGTTDPAVIAVIAKWIKAQPAR